MKKLLKIAMGVVCVTAFACGVNSPDSQVQEHWNVQNDPRILSGKAKNYEYRFAKLPLSAKLPVKPWSDDYWQSVMGGIAYRWRVTRNQDKPADEGLIPTLSQLKLMKKGQLDLLSPAEKFDIFLGRYDFPLTHYEFSRTRSSLRRVKEGENKDWVGICHGWAPAALLYEEPKPVQVTSPDGTKINFGSSDIKALLSLYLAAYETDSKLRFLGQRCETDLKNYSKLKTPPECIGTNAGAFHVALTNQIALRKTGFVADIPKGLEVWNQPVFGYESTVTQEQGPSVGAAAGTVKEVTVKTRMFYAAEVDPSWNPVVGTDGNRTEFKDFRYLLEINRTGEIIGGKWTSDLRPGFIWTATRPTFTGDFAPLTALYNASVSPAGAVPAAVPGAAPNAILPPPIQLP